MAATSTIIMGIAAAASVAGMVQAKQAQKEQSKVQKLQLQAAEQTATAAEREQKAANARAPDLAGILQANRTNAGGGTGSTLLTGPQGVQNDLLSLGKKSLLGA